MKILIAVFALAVDLLLGAIGFATWPIPIYPYPKAPDENFYERI